MDEAVYGVMMSWAFAIHHLLSSHFEAIIDPGPSYALLSNPIYLASTGFFHIYWGLLLSKSFPSKWNVEVMGASLEGQRLTLVSSHDDM